MSILPILRKTYLDAKIPLNRNTTWNLLVAVILSAQCSDVRVHIVTKNLFKKHKRIEDYLTVEHEKLLQDIRSTDFYRKKAKKLYYVK